MRPDWLSAPIDRARWHALAPLAQACRRSLTAEACDVLARFVTEERAYRVAVESLRATGSYSRDGDNGVALNPAMEDRRHAAQEVQRLAVLLGFLRATHPPGRPDRRVR